MLKKFFWFIILPLLLSSALFTFFDFGQCDRKCSLKFSPKNTTSDRSIKGINLFSKCLCYHTPLIERKYENEKSFRKLDPEIYCGADGKEHKLSEKKNVDPLHDGKCGKCSNLHDINVMKVTKMNLTKIATKCAKRYLFFGYSFAKKCMEENVGFTEGCTNCWIENMGCTISHCIWICTKEVFLKGLRNNQDDGGLNPCLECDEVNCGPEFIKCVGANRRKSGILTDIDRPDNEIFKVSK